MTTLCYAYKNVNRYVIDGVKEMVRDGFFTKEDTEKLVALQKLANGICGIYKIDPITVVHEAIGQYAVLDRISRKIYLTNTSIVSTLNCLRLYAIQSDVAKIPEKDGRKVREPEVDAQAWATSVYRKACPVSFRKAVTEGRIPGIKINEEGKYANKAFDDCVREFLNGLNPASNQETTAREPEIPVTPETVF